MLIESLAPTPTGQLAAPHLPGNSPLACAVVYVPSGAPPGNAIDEVNEVPLIGTTQPGSLASRAMPVEMMAKVAFLCGPIVLPKRLVMAVCLSWASLRVTAEPSACVCVALMRPHFLVG